MKQKLNTFGSMASFACSALSTFFLIPLVKESMGLEAYGYIAITLGLVNSMSVITIAITPMITRFITMSLAKGDDDAAARYYATSLVSSLALSLIVILVSVVVAAQSRELFSIQQEAYRKQVTILCVLCGMTLGVSVSAVPHLASLYHTKELYYYYSFLSISQVARVAVPAVMYRVTEPTLWLPYAASLTVDIIAFVFYISYRRRRIPELRFIIDKLDCMKLREMLGSGIWSSIERAGKTLISSLNSVVTNMLLGAYYAGMYASMAQVQQMVAVLATTIAGSFVPVIYELYATSETEILRAYLRKSESLLNAMLGVIGGCALVYADDFFSLWIGISGADTRISLYVMMLAVTFSSSTEVYVRCFMAANKLKMPAIASLMMGLINIVMIYMLSGLADMGIVGVALGSSISVLLLTLVCNSIYILMITPATLYDVVRTLRVTAMTCAFSCAVCLPIEALIKIGGWVGLLVRIGSSVLAIALITGVFFRRRLIHALQSISQP